MMAMNNDFHFAKKCLFSAITNFVLILFLIIIFQKDVDSVHLLKLTKQAGVIIGMILGLIRLDLWLSALVQFMQIYLTI